MDSIKVVLAGLGNVGRSFARRSLADSIVQIVAISDSTGDCVVESPERLESLLGAKHEGQVLNAGQDTRARSGMPSDSEGRVTPGIVRRAMECGASVLVEALPTNIATGEPGLSLIRSALSSGLHVVTVDKGPMVRGFEELIRTAAQSRVNLAYTGTTGVEIPKEVGGSEVLEIRGVLNGTTNYILTEMQSGTPYQEALARAQEAGIAEPNPSLDVGGWDTACKILILAKTLMGARNGSKADSKSGEGPSLEDVVRTGIGPDTERLIQIGRDTGRVVRLVGRARIWQGRLRLSVTPKLVGPESPFYTISGTSKAAVFRTREHGEVVAEARSGRRSIAEVILKDVLAVSG